MNEIIIRNLLNIVCLDDQLEFSDLTTLLQYLKSEGYTFIDGIPDILSLELHRVKLEVILEKVVKTDFNYELVSDVQPPYIVVSDKYNNYIEAYPLKLI